MEEELILDKEPSAGQYSEYYSHRFLCFNCLEYTRRYIKKGHRHGEFSVPCDRCGCLTSINPFTHAGK